MILRALACLVCIAAPATVSAQSETPAEAARLAARQIEDAALALEQADGARDRVRALTQTVHAYEAGLAAMRDGLRRAAIREAQLTTQLAAREEETAALLGALQGIAVAPEPVLMLHPDGPIGSARSGMILTEIVPVLNARAAVLRKDLEEVRTLRLLQQNAAQTLENGLSGVQQARADLSQAVADRTDLPRRFTQDPVRTAILISSTETLEAFASGLGQIVLDGDISPAPETLKLDKGNLPLPALGVVIRRAGEKDAAGIARDGIILATRPRALVTTPTAATVRYMGPLLDFGNVVILEPAPETLFVLSGLDLVFGEVGQVLPEGEPVGLMGGADPELGEIVSTSGDDTGTDRSETLYIEVREGNSPVDPETWFKTDKDG